MTIEQATDRRKELLFAPNQAEFSVQNFSYKAIQYCEELIAILESISKSEDSDISSLMCYIWGYEAKDFSILLRDSTLKILKLDQYHKDGLRTDEEVKEYKEKLADIIKEASEFLSNSFHQKSTGKGEYNIEWAHQESPVPLIINQIKTISDQIKKIQRIQHKLEKVNFTFDQFRESYFILMDQRSKLATFIHDILSNLLGEIKIQENIANKPGLSKILLKIKATIDRLEKQDTLISYDTIIIEDNKNLKIPVDTIDGDLIYKSIDVLSEISGWTSVFLSPALKSIDHNLVNYKERIIIGLSQLYNRLKARADMNDEMDTSSEDEAVSLLQKLINEQNINDVLTTSKNINHLRDELNKHITTSQLFTKDYNFLPSSKLGQLSRFGNRSELEKRYNLSQIKSKLTGFKNRLFSKYLEEEKVTASGFIERVLSFDPESDANALFLKKGFLGSSFTVKRPEIEEKISQHFRLWQSGYGGALLISGGCGSGKSTLIEQIPIFFPDITFYNLSPDQKLDVNGHNYTMTHDLVDGIEFIIKNIDAQNCIIAIDQLDSFSHNPANTFEIIDQLKEIVRKHSKRIYFVFAAHKYLVNHLSQYYNLDNIFSKILSTDFMATTLIEKAISTRAYALADHEELLLRQDSIVTSARKISKRSNHNIGYGLQLWCNFQNSMSSRSTNIFYFRKKVLDHNALLKSLLEHHTLAEPEIKLMLNDADSILLRDDIASLVQIKLLQRPAAGLITINPYIRAFVEQIIEKI